MERKRLTDILHPDEAEGIRAAWEQTEAADDLAPIPPGTYEARLVRHELFKARSGTPGLRLVFQIREGEFAGRQVFYSGWLTPAALPFLKRDLSAIGLMDFDSLSKPTPQGILCRVRVALRRNDEGDEWNEARRFQFAGTEAPDPFAPQLPDEQPPTASAEPEAESPAEDSDDDPDTPF